MPKTKTDSAASAATAAESTTKRVRRVAVGPTSVTFTLPSGESVTVERAAFHADSNERAWAYGVTQLYQDSLARGKDEPKATDDDARSAIARFESGDWKATRGAGDGRPTMEGVARAIVSAKYPTLPKSGDEFKGKVTLLLDESADPARYAIVVREYDKAVANWEATRGVEVEI